jgi:hypothetical protein
VLVDLTSPKLGINAVGVVARVVIWVEGNETLEPSALVAVTVKVYSVLDRRPVTITSPSPLSPRAVIEAVFESGVEVAV